MIDYIGIDYKAFSKSVVLGQNILNNFISGSRDDRRTIIEEMLGIKILSFSKGVKIRDNKIIMITLTLRLGKIYFLCRRSETSIQ